jgi:hypothetical protein
LKVADIGGMNNAFWLTTPDKYEIDVTEFRLPNYDHMNLRNWDGAVKSHTVGSPSPVRSEFKRIS